MNNLETENPYAQSVTSTPTSNVQTGTAAPRQYYPFEFTGRAGEYFRIWIVNVVLSILTLGIYSAWAKVRTNKYFYGNTLLDGSAFDYTADPKKILIGRIIAVVLFAIYQVVTQFFFAISSYVFIAILLVVPVILVMSLSFRMRYSNWRGINFRFHGSYRYAYLLLAPILIYFLALLITPILLGVDEEVLLQQQENADQLDPALINYLLITFAIAFIFMILFPLWQKWYYRYIGNRVAFGKSRFSFVATGWEFYGFYLVAFAIGFLALFILGIFAGIIMAAIMAGGGGDPSGQPSLVATYTLIGIMSIPYIFIMAYIQTKLTNVIYGNLEVEEVCFESTLEVGAMAWLYFTNTLAILCSLGLAIPWTKIRMAKYRADHMRLLATDFQRFIADARPEVDAKAEAVSDIFDLDIGL